MMQQSITCVTVISICISFIALIISAIALWKNHFGKFKPITMTGDLGLRIYPIISGSDKWYIPSFDVAVSITNPGVRPGKILGMRTMVSYPSLPIPGNQEIFEPKWEINYQKFSKSRRDRFSWIDSATIDWMPFVVLPKTTITKHLIIESRWDNAVIQQLQICLEMCTDANKKWIKLNSWEINIDAMVWSELTDVGTSFTLTSKHYKIMQKQLLTPPDLHKYTGTKDSLPSNGFNAEPSYLAYPEKDDDCENIVI